MSRFDIILPSLLVAASSLAMLPGAVAAQTNGHGASAAADAPPALRAERVARAPSIDGVLDEDLWQAAEVAEGFTQIRPNPGRAATQRTEVRILYDDEAVYVGARMYDTAPDSIVAQLGRRDNNVYSDWFYVAFDSYYDRRTAFGFGLNPRGVMVDILLHNDNEDDGSWDAVWEGAAEQDAEGWSAEFRIPLSQLRFSEAEAGREQVWGVNFLRNIARNGEEAFWAPIQPDGSRVVSAFGDLRGLAGLTQPRRLEVMPYVVASATRAPGSGENPFYRETDPFGGAGADIKAGITSDLTLTATINPDFGQVEADPSVVNLTAAETFYPEKRPFFVEGVDIFRFGIGLGDGDLGNESLFYSRRIGRAPQGDVDADYADVPGVTTILAAAKLSGKTAGGWSIGVLDALTSDETARYELGGTRGEVPVEPLTNYGVARVIKDFREGKSAVGGIFTATNRSLPDGGELDWLRRSAYTGGVDFRHRFAGDGYQLGGSIVGSRVSGTADAIDAIQTSPVHYFQRPDADHIAYDPERTSLQGFAAKTELFKLQGNWRFALFGMTVSPGFEANDLGFQGNSDLAMTGYWVGYQDYEPGKVFRNWWINNNAWGGTNYGGDVVALGGNVNGGFQLNNFWGANGGVNINASEYSPSMLRGGPSFLRPGQVSFWSSMYTDSRKAIRGSFGVNGSARSETDGRSLGANAGVTIRPSDNADLYVGPSFYWNRNPIQYVQTTEALGETWWLLGTVEQRIAAMTARLNYTFSPTLSLQLYAQPFIAAGAYDQFKYVADPRAARYDDRVHVFADDEISASTTADGTTYAVDLNGDAATDAEFGDPAFNFKELRSNVVLRWEYRPGSSVFLVWSQGRNHFANDGRFQFGDDLGQLWEAQGTNVLMLKVSYWFGL